MEKDQSVLDDDRIGRLLLKLAFPAFIGIFVTALYNVIDTFFIGHFVGSLGIAGISIVFPVQMLSMGFGMMFGVGGASLISRSIGSDEIEKAEHTIGNALVAVVVLLIIVLLIGLSNRDNWLRLMGASDNVLPYSRDYFTIILFGLIFQTMAMAMNALIMSEGNGRIAMTGTIIGALSNIILDALFIVVLDMGVQGAAIGTVIAQFLAVLFLTSYYYSGNSFIKIHYRNMTINWNILKEIIAVGSSSFMTTIASSLSIVFLNRMLVTYGGDIAVSAYGIINRLIIFTVMPGVSIGQGLQPILGFNYGVGRYDRVLKLLEFVIVCLTFFGLLMFGALFFAPEIFIRIFTNEIELIAMGSYAGKFIFSTVFFTGFIISGTFIFQALGKAKRAFIITLRPVIFLLPLVLIMPRIFQLKGVFLAYPLTEVFGFTLAMSMVIPQIREFRRLFKHQEN